MALHHNPRIVTNGLVLHLDAADRNSYPGSGTTFTDLSGNGNNATLQNGTSYSSDNGGTLVYDGADDKITIQNSTSLSSFTSISFNFWVRFYNLDYVNTTGTLYNFLRKGSVDVAATDPPTPHYGFWASYENRNNNGRFSYFAFGNEVGGYNGGGNNFASIYYTFNNNQWYNISATLDASELGKVYVNGELQGSKQLSGVNLNTSANMETVFQDPVDYPIAQIYNRALTASEVLQNYNATKTRFGL